MNSLANFFASGAIELSLLCISKISDVCFPINLQNFEFSLTNVNVYCAGSERRILKYSAESVRSVRKSIYPKNTIVSVKDLQ